jgi:maleylpyruvate isomerase
MPHYIAAVVGAYAMIVYEYFRSSASFRLRIALNLKGLASEKRYVNLAVGEQKQAAHKAVNPQGFVPYLIDDDFELSQSLAIIEYLDEKHPTPPLLPADIRLRARSRQIAQIVACDIHPVNNSRILGYLTNDLKLSDAERTRWICGWIHDGFVAIEALLSQTNSTFCVGDSPTLADICLIPQVFNANRFACSLDKFPRINQVFGNAMKLDAFDLAQPSKQADSTL